MCPELDCLEVTMSDRGNVAVSIAGLNMLLFFAGRQDSTSPHSHKAGIFGTFSWNRLR